MPATSMRHRILFVDDEESILFAVRDYFGSEGYDVDVARDAEEAEALLAERAYAVVVIDLRLGPGNDQRGLELVSHVREQHPAAAVMLFTAFGTPEVEHEARRRGAIFLQKPVPLLVIGSVLERLRPTLAGDDHAPRATNIQPDGVTTGHLAGPRPPRIALYSHDTMGLGHMRRNLLLAQTLGASQLNAAVLMIAGAREAATFTIPAGVDCLTLPALSKDGNGRYEARHLSMGLQQIVTLRSSAIQATLEAFEPDLFIVDNVPRGAVRELDSTLKALRMKGRTRVVLGLRDILDEPAVVRDEWDRAANQQAILDYYDAIWVYGDRLVCDSAVEYGFCAEVADRVRFAGYLDQRQRLAYTGASEENWWEQLGLPPERLVLGLVGGGQDGARLANAFAQAEFPSGTTALLLAGPYMPDAVREQVLRRAALNPRLRVLDFVQEPTLLLRHADRVVAMGGYGTTCEILSFEKHALIIPRVKPRREQFIRAQRLADLGLLHVMHPSDVTPELIGEWLARDLGDAPPVRSLLDLGGLRRIPELAGELIHGRNGVSTTSPTTQRMCHEQV